MLSFIFFKRLEVMTFVNFLRMNSLTNYLVMILYKSFIFKIVKLKQRNNVVLNMFKISLE